MDNEAGVFLLAALCTTLLSVLRSEGKTTKVFNLILQNVT